MAGVAIRQRSELSQMLARILRPRQEVFAACVASGMSYRTSARRAGFHEDHGNRLMRRAAIRERVEELREAPEAERFLAGIQANLFLLDNRAGSGNLRDIRRQLKLADARAKFLRAIDGGKRASDARLDLCKISRADLDAMIERDLERLAPGERERIRRIAVGEDDAADGEGRGPPG